MFEVQPEASLESPSADTLSPVAAVEPALPKRRGRPRKLALEPEAPEVSQAPEIPQASEIALPPEIAMQKEPARTQLPEQAELLTPPETVVAAKAAPKTRARKAKPVMAEEAAPEPPKARARGRKKAEETAPAVEPTPAAKPRVRGKRAATEVSAEMPEQPLLEIAAPELEPTETQPPETTASTAPRQRLVRVRKAARENVFETQAKLTNPLEMLLEYLRANPGGHSTRDLEKELEDEVLKRLGGRKGLEDALETLTQLGALLQPKRHTYSLAREVAAVVGRLWVRPDGWGVVQPETPGLREMLIAPDALLFAWNADRVVARETKRNGEAYGRVIRVLERARNLVVGTLEFVRGTLSLRPDEPSLPRLPLEATDAAPGARVVVAPRYPESTGEDDAYGVVVRVLGATDSLETEREAVRVKFNLPNGFSAEAQKEAQKVAGVLTKDLQGRVDLRGKRVVAASVHPGAPLEVGVQAEPLGNGNVLVGIHLADAQHFVDDGKALDREALQRGATVYLAGQLEPLLPDAVTNSVALEVGADRLAISVLVESSPDGNVVNYIVRQSVINAKARLEDGLGSAEAALLERLGSGLRAARGGGQSTLLEELLLLANRLVAATLASQEAPALYRYVQHQTADLESALERSGGASPAMLAALRQAHTPPMQFIATAFPELEYQLELTCPLSRYADLLNQRILVYAITKLSARRKELLEEHLPQIAGSLAALEQRAQRAETSLKQYQLLGQISPETQVKGIATRVDPWGLDFTLENGANARLSIPDMDDEYYYSDAPLMLKARGGRVFKPGSIARVFVIGINAPERLIRLSLGKENPMSKQKRAKSAQSGPDVPRRQVVVLHAKPRGEYQRGVRVTARKLYFGEWSRANFIASDEFGGEIQLERPQAERAQSQARGGMNRQNRPAAQGQSRPAAQGQSAARPSSAKREAQPAQRNPERQPHQPKPSAAQNNAASRASRIAELKRRAEQTLERNVARANRGPAEGNPSAEAPRAQGPSTPAVSAPVKASKPATEEAAQRSTRRRRRGGRGPKTTPPAA